MIDLIHQNVTEIFAGLALLLAVNSNRIAVQTRTDTQKTEMRNTAVHKAEKRTMHLVEIERKNAAIVSLKIILAKKLTLIQKYPVLANKYLGERNRLINQLNLMQQLHNGVDEQRSIAEKALDGNAFELHEKALADTRRLCTSLETEALTELGIYTQLKEEVTVKAVS